MPPIIIPQSDENEQELNSSITKFIKDYKISKLMRLFRGEKEKGISALDILCYLFCLTF